MTIRDTLNTKLAILRAQQVELQKLLDSGGAWPDQEPAAVHAFIDRVLTEVIPALNIDVNGVITPPPTP